MNKDVYPMWWTVTENAASVREYKFTKGAINNIKKIYASKFSSNNKNVEIRFSNVVNTDFPYSNTQYNDNINTAYKFFIATTDWHPIQRGSNGDWDDFPGDSLSGYGYEAYGSGLNLYDNILVLPTNQNKKTTILINVVDEKGNKLNVSDRDFNFGNSGNNFGYRWKKELKGDEKLNINSKEEIYIGGKKYKFSYGKDAFVKLNDIEVNQNDVNQATLKLNNVPQSWQEKEYKSKNNSNLYVVNLVYEKEEDAEKVDLSYELGGKLCFINDKDNEYKNSTISENIDYIASTGSLRPYIKGIPKVLYTDLTLKSNFDNYFNTINYKIRQPFEYMINNVKKVGTYEINVNFNLRTKYKYFENLNLEAYKLNNFILYDDTSNIGDKLFDNADKQTIKAKDINYQSNIKNVGNNTTRPYINSNNIIINRNKLYGGNKKTARDVKDFLNRVANLVNNSCPNYASQILSNNNVKFTFNEFKNPYLNKQLTNKVLNVSSRYNFKNDSDVKIEKGGIQVYNDGSFEIYSPTTEVNLKDEIIDMRRDSDFRNKHEVTSKDLKIKYENLVKNNNTDLTDKNSFEKKYFNVPMYRDNGERILSAKVEYQNVNGSGNIISKGYGPKFNGNDRNKLKNKVNIVNVFTPIDVKFELKSKNSLVSHTIESSGNKNPALQKGIEFTIVPSEFKMSNVLGYSNLNTKNFIKGYYYLFDFDVKSGNTVYPANTLISINSNAGPDAKFTAMPISYEGESSADFASNKYKIIAVAKNIPYNIEQVLLRDKSEYKYAVKGQNTNYNSSLLANAKNNHDYLGSNSELINDGYHVFMTKNNATNNINRIFDFKITDCSDLAYKEVFRKSTNGNVNKPTGNVYYGGTKYFDYTESGSMINHVNNANLKMPLGPNSHNNGKYKFAPKLGYRISFDFKTSGYMKEDAADRTAKIVPHYYYISKDGKRFINENEFKLYYLNDKNKYVELNNNYNIYYKPDNGYRYVLNVGVTKNENLSKEFLRINISDIKIAKNSMSFNNDRFIQAWYGEFKLPNSTIVAINGDINNPLKDGYLGVVFDISVSANINNNIVTLKYGINDNNANPNTNTSQWDYEGFMGFNNPGSEANLQYKLERGTWNINNDTYQKIKGTVMLYDLDNRAANDFE